MSDIFKKVSKPIKAIGLSAILALSAQVSAAQTPEQSMRIPDPVQGISLNIQNPKLSKLALPTVKAADFLNRQPDQVERIPEIELETRIFDHKDGTKTSFAKNPESISISHYNKGGEKTHEVDFTAEDPTTCRLAVFQKGSMVLTITGTTPKSDLFAVPDNITSITYQDKAGSWIGVLYDAKGKTNEARVIQNDGNTVIFNFNATGKITTKTVLDADGNTVSTTGNKDNFKTCIPPFRKGNAPSK